MSDVLAKICAEKREHVALKKAERSFAEVEQAAKAEPAVRGFIRALRAIMDSGAYGLIAELKKASPSKGLIRKDFNPPALATAYQSGGAACLSVLTDKPYFQGDDAFLLSARAAVTLPVLRKDFMVDPYQIAESRALGADCILLIMAALEDGEAADLEAQAMDYGMDVLVEVHDAIELDRALRLKSPLLGINNRNLKTLQVDIATTEALAENVPADKIMVCESGLFKRADLDRMAKVGARCFLIGESLMREQDVAAATRALLNPGMAA